MQKIGLSLSGGGARGFAHLGMIKALEEEAIQFDVIAGASAGAIVGLLYATGRKADEIYEITSKLNFLKIFRPALNWRGLLKLENVATVLRQYIENDNFASLKVPLIICATDLRKGKIKYFRKGELIQPTLASCSIPVVFDPVTIGKSQYIDGGILDNLPVKPLKKEADFIIGMHVNPIQADYEPGNWKDLMERSLLMAVSSGTYLKKKKCDLFWEPQELARFKVFDYKKSKEMYEIGYKYARDQIQNGALKKLERKTVVS
jgi:NTE family protein